MQYVQVSGWRSELYRTRSGVGQESTLSATQILLMINDLPEVVRVARCFMFADDLKLFVGVKRVEDCSAPSATPIVIA